MARINFTKTYSNSADLVKLLKSRGMEINDEHKAEDYLENIGYYRLSAYMYPLLKSPKTQHQYKIGASFKKVMMLYRFDKKLRMLMFNEIEKIEIAVREAVMNITAEMSKDDFWLMNSEHFANLQVFTDTANRIGMEYRKSTEDFIQHFKNKYTNQYPPVWILGELLTMGTINIVYRNLKENRIRKAISHKFGLQPKVFESWITTLTLVRNSCCHHSRVWNKKNIILPMMPRRIHRPWITQQVDPQRTYFNICIIKYFLDVISPNNDMLTKLRWLFVDFTEVDLKALGFPNGWEFEPLWK
ncbi:MULTISPECIES: Abi family protein [unclassified Bacteroides]|uniref:Abi family protein n=1 Tax=unclassified Bacteroides TaxID=2646097 RepID=UPI0004E0B85E|nr:MULTISPECIES: Abi family protein [unclassified Bacteroides]